MPSHDRRRASTDARIALRQQVVTLRAQGRTLTEIAQITGYARTYCSTLVRTLTADPTQQDTVARGGRPVGVRRALSKADEKTAQRLICGQYPDQLSLPFALWTRPAIRELVRVKCGVHLSVRAVGDYCQRWGYTPQKATRRAYEQNPKAVQQWLTREFPNIRARARAEGAELNWSDETGVRSDSVRPRGYAPKGHPPLIRIPARRSSLSVLAAITNQGAVRFMVYRGALTTRHLITFMQRLIRAAGRKVFLILDNLNVHKAKAVRTWVAAHRAEIEVFYLPSYSPERNPSEYFNGDLKGSLARDVPARDAADLHRKVHRHARRIQRQHRRVANYFRHPLIAYAA
jgi:transposase